jgi:peptide chain release factor 1
MFDRLADLESELERLEATLPDLYASGDQRTAADAGRRAAELRPVVEAFRTHRERAAALADARGMLEQEQDAEMRAFLRDEVTAQEAAIAALEQDLRELLIPKDPNDGRNVIVEIRGAEGATRRTSGPVTSCACTSGSRRPTAGAPRCSRVRPPRWAGSAR